MDSTELKDQINEQITEATAVNSITPTIVGDNLTDIVDYVDQEINTVNTVTSKTIGTLTAVSLVNVNAGSGTITNDFTNVSVGVEINNYVAIDETNNVIGKSYTIRNTEALNSVHIKFRTGTKYWSEEAGDFDTDYILPVLGTVEFVYAENDTTDKVYHAKVVHTTNFYKPTLDTSPTEGSTNGITSDAVYQATFSKAEDADVVKLSGNQIISDLKTFQDNIEVPYPTDDSHAANKLYVDSAISDYANADTPKVWTVKTQLTQADVLNLFTTPIEVLSSTTGDIAYPISIYIIKSTGTGYTFADSNFALIDDAGTVINQFTNTPFQTSQGFISYNLTLPQSRTGTTLSSSFKLKALTGNPTVGTGGLDVYVTYIILKTD